MAEKEAAEMLQAKLTCMKLEDLSCVGEGCSRDCNDCEYNYKQGTIEEHEKALELAIKALKEIQQYRAIGTVEECREAKRFKEYFDELYGTGLEVANWHENGNTEPFDNFYDAAIDWSKGK